MARTSSLRTRWRHGLVGEPERLPSQPIVAQQVHCPVQPVGDRLGLGQRQCPGRGVAGHLLIGVHQLPLGSHPVAVTGHQRPQPRHQVIACQVRVAQALHVQHQPRNRRSLPGTTAPPRPTRRAQPPRRT